MIETLPTFEAFGHPPAANWASVQAARPLATAGDSAVPFGSVTDTFCTSGVARPYASLFCGTFRSTS